ERAVPLPLARGRAREQLVPRGEPGERPVDDHLERVLVLGGERTVGALQHQRGQVLRGREREPRIERLGARESGGGVLEGRSRLVAHSRRGGLQQQRAARERLLDVGRLAPARELVAPGQERVYPGDERVLIAADR